MSPRKGHLCRPIVRYLRNSVRLPLHRGRRVSRGGNGRGHGLFGTSNLTTMCVYRARSGAGSSRHRQYVDDVHVGPHPVVVSVLRRRAAHRLPSVGGGGRLDREGEGGAGVRHGFAAAHVGGHDTSTTRHRLHGQRGCAESVRRRCSSHRNHPHSATQCP